MTKEVQLNIENNKEKYCSICGEVLDINTWGKSYCRTCRAAYNQDYYINKVANRRFIYSLWAGDRCIYVGSCISIYRVVQHLKGGTHLKFSPEQWAALDIDKLIYTDVTDITYDNKERRYIEKLWFDMFSPLFNKENPMNEVIDIERMEILEDLIYNHYIDIEEIPIKKITSPDGKVTFNFNDLILS